MAHFQQCTRANSATNLFVYNVKFELTWLQIVGKEAQGENKIRKNKRVYLTGAVGRRLIEKSISSQRSNEIDCSLHSSNYGGNDLCLIVRCKLTQVENRNKLCFGSTNATHTFDRIVHEVYVTSFQKCCTNRHGATDFNFQSVYAIIIALSNFRAFKLLRA